MNLKKVYFLFAALFFYYILSPILLIIYYQIDGFSVSFIRHALDFSYSKTSNKEGFDKIYFILADRLYLYKIIQNENYKYYEIFSISFSIIFFLKLYYFLKNIKVIHARFVVEDQKFILITISIICIFFLLKDLLLIINYYYSTKTIIRDELYELINNRKTYLNILIFVSVINFKLSQKLSYLSYSLILVYDGLSLSRYSIFILVILHYFINIDLNRKNLIKWFYFFLIIFSIIFYRIVIQNRQMLTFFSESFDVRLGSQITFNYFHNITLEIFFFENIKFILRDFFYLDFFIINPLQKSNFPIFSARGFDTIICYFLVFIVYITFYFFLVANVKINIEFINCSNIFLLISLFRGNFVHNLNFVIKLYLLVIFIQWLIKILRRLKLKVV